METAADPENRGPVVLATAAVLVSLSTFFGLARFYARSWKRRQVYIDDLFVVLSVATQWFGLVCVAMGVAHGQGRHIETLDARQRSGVYFWYNTSVPALVMALCLPKLAVAAILNRILLPGLKAKAAAWALATTSTMAFVAVILVIVFQCTPVRAQWDLAVQDKKCMDIRVIVICSTASSAFSAVVDFYFAVWPAVVFATMQMSRVKTIGLSLAMGLGTIASSIAAYKCASFSGLASPDFSWGNNPTVMTTVAEGTALIMAASIPMLAPMYRSVDKSCKRLKSRVLGTPVRERRPPEPRPENIAWDFPTRKRMRPRDEADLNRSSLATSDDPWDRRHLYSMHTSTRNASSKNTYRTHSTRPDTRSTELSHDLDSRLRAEIREEAEPMERAGM